MVIRNKEYYTQFNEEMKRDYRALDYRIRQAENYKRIYQLTRGRSGVYVLLNKFAKRMNQVHCNKGTKLAKLDMAWCLYEMAAWERGLPPAERWTGWSGPTRFFAGTAAGMTGAFISTEKGGRRA